MLCLVCKVAGILCEINPDLVEEMRHMKSFNKCEIFLKLGQKICLTTNCFNLAGVVVLTHPDENVVIQDYNRIREMEDSNIFVVS